MLSQEQIFDHKRSFGTFIFMQFVYENDDPSQSLKMLSEKLGISDKIEYSNLIFPFHHIKDSFNDKQISLFFIKDYLIPLRFYEKKPLTIKQSL